MNRKERRASAGKNLTCDDCGSHQIASKADYGWLCLPCLGKRNERASELVRDIPNLIACQQIDTDGPPVQCGNSTCKQDAAVIYRIWDGERERGFTGCTGHSEAAFAAAWRFKELADAR